MRIYNRYIITVAAALLVTTLLLIIAGQASLDLYFSIYVIEALIVTELYIYFSRKSRRALNIIGITLFGSSAIVLCLQVLKVIL
jgi:hypothetical protein